MRLARSLLCAVGLLPLLPLLAAAGEPPHCPRPLRVALHDFGLLYSKAERRGIDKDLVEELARRSGCRFRLEVMPRARIWKMLENGTLDMSTSGVLTAERAAYVYVINNLALKNFVVLRADSGVASLAGFLADPRQRLGVIRGFTYGPGYDALIERLRRQGRVDNSTTFTQLYDKFAAGRFQATLSQPINYHPELAKRRLLEQVEILDWMPAEPPLVGGLVLARRRFSAAEADKWRQLVEGMLADGSMLAILRRYLPAEEGEAMLRLR